METKPGYTTTEFWLTLGSVALAHFSPIAESIGPKTAAVAGAASAAVYTFSRAWAKAQHGSAPPRAKTRAR